MISRALPPLSSAMRLMVSPSSKSVSDEKPSTLQRQLLPLGPGLDGFGAKSLPNVSPKKIPYSPGFISHTTPKSVPPTFHVVAVLVGVGKGSSTIGRPVTRAIRLTYRMKKPQRLSTSSNSSFDAFPSR